MMYPALRRLLPLGVCLVVILPARVAWTEKARVDFSRDIRPILSDVCYKCHGPDEEDREADLRLDVKSVVFGELPSGCVPVVPGNLDESELYRRVTATDDERMPPDDHAKHLTPEQVTRIRQWIEQGAPWRGHWAFTAPVRPPVPTVRDGAWPRGAIDRFILARLEREGLHPSAEADRTTLIRRVTLDLTGLPPTPAAVDRFLADRAPDAYERLVHRLFQSPHYGEQMAHYWLDAARYGDTHGLHLDNERLIWPYRDWVVAAFNKNMPFDQFTIEQLAGDMLPGATRAQRIATGFNRCHVTTNEGGVIKEEFYVRNVNDRVETTATVWLGLTAGCAVCHDHKFDPLTRKEFYQLFAFFNSTADNAMDGNAKRYPPVVRLATPEQQASLGEFDKKLAGLNDRIKKIEAAGKALDALLGKATGPETKTARTPPSGRQKLAARETPQGKKIRPSGQGGGPGAPAVHAAGRRGLLGRLATAFQATLKGLQTRRAELQKQRTALDDSIPTTMVMQELSKPRVAFDLERGEYDKHGDKVRRAMPAFLPPLPKGSPVNRLGLAQWLVDRSNPLTARVTVNRLWQHLFGVGIVETAENFGSQGHWPSHPKLLDWLAVEMIDSHWDVQHMLRLMVTSATYRQSAAVTPERLKADPRNRLLARGPRFRMDAEMIRDTALAVSGLLSPRIGGKPVKPYQPAGIWKAVGYTSSNTANYHQDHGEALYRRSLYTFWKRTAPPPAMVVLDAPTREECRVRRPRTNTPLAALALMNDTQLVEAARHLATRAMREGGADPTDCATWAFRLATARRPDATELKVLLRVYQQQLGAFQANRKAARALITVGESKPDASLNPCQLAAWTMVANLILNLDETVVKG